MAARRVRRIALLLTVTTAALSLGPPCAGSTHSATEPTWYFQGIVASDVVKMKHVTAVHDPDGIVGALGEPEFMMWWGTGAADELYVKTSNDGEQWSDKTHCDVGFPESSTVVPVYHPEVIYDRQGFAQKKSTGAVHFKMWFYDGRFECPASYNWMRYAESADGVTWRVYEDSAHAASGGKNYLEFSGGSGNEVSVLYRRGGTGIVVNGIDQEYVGYQATSVVGVSSDGAWFATASGQGGGPTDVCREMIIAADADAQTSGVAYRAWDDLPGHGDLTSWDSATGLSWDSPQAGSAPISGASWSDLYGGMCVVAVGDRYYMYDTMDSDNYSVGLLVASVGPASEVWVDDDWTCQDDVDGSGLTAIWGHDAFGTIQGGIDAVAPGGTVNVAAGIYEESVAVGKPLALLGAKRDVDPRGGAWIGGASVIDPGPGNTGIDIGAAHVTVNGFEVAGGMYGILVAPGAGDVSDVTIQFNELHGCTKYGCQLIDLVAGAALSGATLSRNYIHDNDRNGLKMVDVADCVVDSNEFAFNGFGAGSTTPEYRYGIFLEDERYNHPSYGPAINNTFTGNAFHDNCLGAMNLEAMGNASSSHWSSTEFLEGTVVRYNSFYGDSSVWGIRVDDDYRDDGTQDGFGPIATVDATRNWWGSPTGPHRQLPNGKWVGKGDRVSGDVGYTPWLPRPAESSPVDHVHPLTVSDRLEVVAYPNPVRDVHTATFRVKGTLAAEVEEIRVQIFDLSGRLVWEDAALGSELDWHTDSLSGDYLANGVYLYRVQVRINGIWIDQDIATIAVLR